MPPRGRADEAIKVLLCRGDDPLLRLWLQHEPAGDEAPVPGARAIGPAILEGYRFFVGLEGWGSVAPSAGNVVHGILWRLTPRDIAALHAYEQLHQGLYDVRHLPVRTEGRRVRAMIYLLRRRARGKPRPGYVEMIAAAARGWKLPEPYVQSVERWSASRWTGARVIDAGDGA